MKVKLIALDLDHTTLKKADVISADNSRAIRDAIEDGIEVIVASGRAFKSLPDAVLEIPGIRYAVTSNGANIFEMKSVEGTAEEKRASAVCIRRNCLSGESVTAIQELFQRYPLSSANKISAELFIEGESYACSDYIADPTRYGVSEAYISYVRDSRIPVEDFPLFVRQHADEIDGLDLQISDDGLLDEVRGWIEKHVPGIYMTASVPHRIEMADRQAGKDNGVRFLCERMGIDVTETAAFGDADNDIGMLRQAGIGIAVSNATHACKAAADQVTKAARKDGVAWGFYRYLEVTNRDEIRRKKREAEQEAALLTEEHGAFMREALTEAEKALELQEVPIGCVIVKNGEVIAKGYNRRNTDRNTLAHAELQAIRMASEKLGDWRLEGCTLYVTLEPCQMCAGAIVQARIDRVVIGAMNPKAGCAGSVLNLMQVPQFNHQVEVIKGVLRQECSGMLQDFFSELRSK